MSRGRTDDVGYYVGSKSIIGVSISGLQKIDAWIASQGLTPVDLLNQGGKVAIEN